MYFNIQIHKLAKCLNLILIHADDVNLIGNDTGTIQINADVLLNACKDISLAVNTGSIKYM
jgi:hypothetical protein